MIKSIKEKLLKALPSAQITITDESANHIEHEPTGAHLAATIIWAGFKDLSLIEQHQKIYNILKEEMKEQIHALRLITKVN